MTDLVAPQPQSKMKSLVGRRQSKNVKFMGEDVKITKLTTGQVQEVQALSRQLEEAQKSAPQQDEAPADDGIAILRHVIRTSVEGADELTDEDFLEFPLGDLNTLVETIMEFSGVNGGK